MIDKETLLKAALPEETVEVPGRGTVRVRALTRAEALRLHAAGGVEAEVLALTAGLVDPAITADEARELLEATCAGDLQPVVDAIMALSGMTEGAQKSGRTRPDGRRDGPVPVPSGNGLVDDARGT